MTYNANCPECGCQEGEMHKDDCKIMNSMRADLKLNHQPFAESAMRTLNRKIEDDIMKSCGPTRGMLPRDKHIFERMVGINPHHRVFIKDDEVKVQGISHTDVYMDESAEIPSFDISDQPAERWLITMTDDNGNFLGGIKFNKILQKWEFHGDMDQAAQQFVRMVNAHWQSIIDGDHDGLITGHPPCEDLAEPEEDLPTWPTRVPHQL